MQDLGNAAATLAIALMEHRNASAHQRFLPSLVVRNTTADAP